MSTESSGKLVGVVPVREGQTELRVALHEWKGRRFVDVRRWEKYSTTGEIGPTRAGVRFDVDLLAELLPMLEDAGKGK